MVSIIKTIIIGPYSVGKTSLLTKYMDGTFNNYDALPTIGVDFRVKNFQSNNLDYRMQIWDTAGHERFHSLIKSYFKDVDCVIFCFSLKDKKTIFELDKMIDEYQNTNSYTGIKILVGTYSDEYDEVVGVQQDEISSLMLRYYIPYYYRVSSKTGENVNQVFDTIIKNAGKIKSKRNKDNEKFVSLNIIKEDQLYNRCCQLI